MKKALAKAPEHKKEAIRAKIVATKAKLARVTLKVQRVSAKIAQKRVSKIEAKIAAATDPKRK